MSRSWRIIGALSEGSFAPLLAEQSWPGGSRLVVLARPPADVASTTQRSPSAHVVGEVDRVTLQGRVLSITPFAPGEDVEALLQAYPDGLSQRALAELATQVLRGLAEAGCPHGALDAGAMRVGPDGFVRLVGWRGTGSDDLETLGDLLEDWGAGPDLLEELAAGPAGMAALDTGGAPLAELSRSVPATPLVDHPWSGTTLAEQASAPAIPPKARTAAFAALALLLGLATGWFYASG